MLRGSLLGYCPPKTGLTLVGFAGGDFLLGVLLVGGLIGHGRRSCCPATLAPRGPVLRLRADARLGACEQAADVGVVADEHQHGDRQRKLNDGEIGKRDGK